MPRLALRLRSNARDLAVRSGLSLVIFVVFALTITGFATRSDIYVILQACVPIGLVALGIGCTIIAGELDLSVAAVATCVGILSIKTYSIGMVPVIVLATLAGMAYGLLQGLIIARLKIPSIVFTLGTLIALNGLAFSISGQGSVVSLTVPQLESVTTLSTTLWIFSPASLILIAGIVIVGLLLGYTRLGRELYAVGGARTESRAAGGPEVRPLVLAFVLSGGLAALAGAVASLQSGSAGADSFDSLLFTAITAILIGGISLYGGRGTAFGVFIGVLTLQFLLAALTLLSTPFWASDFATGALLLTFLIIELTAEQSPVRAALARAQIRHRKDDTTGRSLAGTRRPK
jgi:ribose/xylose/arabinose/galactoside ABC-type transport system permease subunit